MVPKIVQLALTLGSESNIEGLLVLQNDFHEVGN